MKRSSTCSSSSNSSIASPSSPSSPSSSSSLSSSSSSSESPQNVVSVISEKPKGKRVRKNQNQKCISSNANTSRRSSIYRGVTRHRWTGRFEAHLWDKTSWNSIQNKKGRQVYLGAYDSEEDAARTYDLAALKYWGPETTLNFPVERYGKEIEEMNRVSKEEYLASLRRRSSGFSRGISKYRGVARHHHNGRWEARIGRVFGNKYLYLGTYNTEEEAAAAYDMAALEYRGVNAVTNFDISHYVERLKEKGILFLDPTPEQSPSSVEVGPIEVEQQPQQGYEAADEHQHLQNMQMQLPLCNDNATTTVGTETTDGNELAWSFCMDSGLTSFFSPEFLNVFDDMGFEDKVDSLFDLGNSKNAVGRKCLSDEASCVEVGDSSTTSVSCDGFSFWG